MPRQINQAGLDLIRQWEGKYLTAYHGAADRPGLLTIGYGHTDAAGPPKVVAGMTITEQEAQDILRSDLGKVEASVERTVKVKINDNQFAALVSFVYNVGENNFAGSTLLRKLNAGQYDVVPSELMKWTKANGVTVKGLANRRAAEGALWVKGATFTAPKPQAATATKIGGSTTSGAVAGATAAQNGLPWWAVIGIAVAVAVIAYVAIHYLTKKKD